MLVLTLTIFNTLLILTICFWVVNKACSVCQVEMKLSRVFTFKKCPTCAEVSHA